MAWEAAFVRLAAGKLTQLAQGTGLRLSFSTERSVQDELARESTSGGWLLLGPQHSKRVDAALLPSFRSACIAVHACNHLPFTGLPCPPLLSQTC